MFNQQNGGGQGPGASLYPQSMLEEMKAFNAGLTPAGQKSRGPRGGAARGGHGGGRGGFGSGRGRGGYSPGSGVGSHALSARSSNVGSYQSPVSRPPVSNTSNTVRAENSHLPPHLMSRDQANAARFSRPAAPVAVNAYGSPSQEPDTSKSRLPPHLRSRAEVRPLAPKPSVTPQSFGQAAQVAPAAMNAFAAPTPTSNFEPAVQPGRQRIVTNMKTEAPSKPFIPAHFQQKSAALAVEEMANLVGLPLPMVTRDGVSIKGGGSMDTASQAPTPQVAMPPAPAAGKPFVVPQVPVQDDVNPDAFFKQLAGLAGFTGQGFGGQSAAANPFAVNQSVVSQFAPPHSAAPSRSPAFSSEMEVDSVDGRPVDQPVFLGLLSDSRWATAPEVEKVKPIASKGPKTPFEHEMAFYPDNRYTVPNPRQNSKALPTPLFTAEALAQQRAEAGAEAAARAQAGRSTFGNSSFGQSSAVQASSAEAGGAQAGGAAPKKFFLMEDVPKTASKFNIQAKSFQPVNDPSSKTLKHSRWA